jgi:DNA primase
MTPQVVAEFPAAATLHQEDMVSGPAFEIKDRVRQATDIVDLLGSYLPLRRQGSIYVAQCPWHDDQRPSLQVNPKRQSWKCWVCDLGGDVFSFVMKRDNVDFVEALRILAARAGIPWTRGPASNARSDDKQQLFDALQWVQQQYHQCLLKSDVAAAARQYLNQRNITSSSIDKFKIGFAPDDWNWLLDRSRTTSHNAEILKACGVLADGQSGSSYERFKGRIIFPIHDLQHRSIGFGGRIMPEIAARQREAGQREPAKYVNSPETRVFSKSDNLYGLNLVRDAVSRPKELIVVEGYTDVVAAWQAGFNNVVAVLGTALNERHLRLMKRFVERIVLVLDGDEAGRRRANETLELFFAADVDVRVLTLPDELDPCEFLERRGAGEFRELLANAGDALDHKLRCELAGVDVLRDTHRANAALDGMLQMFARRPGSALLGANAIREQQMLARLARQFQVDMETLRQRVVALRGQVRAPLRAAEPAASEYSGRSAALDPKERELLEILLHDEGQLAFAVERISPGQLTTDAARAIYEVYCECHFAGAAADFASIMTRLEHPQLKSLLAELDEQATLKNGKTESEPRERLAAVVRSFECVSLDADNRQLIAKLSQPLPDQEETEALQEILSRVRQRQGLSAPTDGSLP